MSGSGHRQKPFKQPQFFCKQCNRAIQNRSGLTQHNNIYHSKPESPNPAQHRDLDDPAGPEEPPDGDFFGPAPPDGLPNDNGEDNQPADAGLRHPHLDGT